MLTRWRLATALFCWLYLFNAHAEPPATASAATHTILVIGDSLSAEYGLARGSGWVSILAEKLATEKTGYQIQNSSISGDTTSGGVSRLPATLIHHMPDIVIIELGANDALRGLSLDMTRANLAKMIEMVQRTNARVLLIGMEIPPNYGRHYADQFKQLFSSLAAQYKTESVPFLLAGMATDRQQFQSDGIHPTENAQPRLAQNVWAKLKPMLD